MAGKKTPTSIDVLVDIQHGKFGIDHDDSFETWGEAARFLQGITDAIAAKAGPVIPSSTDLSFTATEAVCAITDLTLAANDPNHHFKLSDLAAALLSPSVDGCGVVAGRVDLQRLNGTVTDEAVIEAPVPEAAVITKAPAAPICDKCKGPKILSAGKKWYCKPCWGTRNKPRPAAPAPAAPTPRQTIEAPAVSSIDPAVQNGSRPMLLTEPPVTFPWSDKNFRAALSVLNSPAAERAKHIIMTRRVNSFKSVTPANMRVGDEPVATFHFTNGRWYGAAENHPAAEYLIPEAWYGSKN